VVQRGGVGVDAFADLRAEAPYELRAEQLSGGAVCGDADGDRVGGGVVGLVVVGAAGHGERVVSDRGGLVVAQTGAGDDEVEDLDDLGTEAAVEAGRMADGVSPRGAALFVRGRAEGQVPRGR
jgi:hypothetical protein